ncbi:uncharacterized protein L3040_002780 [Drepanopeziza brunnea f. sp. 'multigermtubi']|uniref:Uncharacterized protein n=1 Tax=Marssonina brunnea f. sp. multigermtubi (strain MB_m1) TaxID=1072389 RepID=K1W864_MARBU|nr:uncharacterized protein MBM_08443 [Drepanopeziza brunnea f. sp. 'multigermtubi' MB_m1]EKD13360.1 hypothetical protein MBM_08443 [Drepanopeziza brunnea f. sp. 'multigermtubi' MB_m1]KAJ5050912.1 hypothetical protein L3040_002780 [Drepanopeziza brunnea f. sp. 'multigermtubi']
MTVPGHSVPAATDPLSLHRTTHVPTQTPLQAQSTNGVGQKWQRNLSSITDGEAKPMGRTTNTIATTVSTVHSWREFAQRNSREPLPPMRHAHAEDECMIKAFDNKNLRGGAVQSARKELCAGSTSDWKIAAPKELFPVLQPEVSAPRELFPVLQPGVSAPRELFPDARQSPVEPKGFDEPEQVRKRKSKELFMYLVVEKDDETEHQSKRSNPARLRSNTAPAQLPPPTSPTGPVLARISPPKFPVAPVTISIQACSQPFRAESTSPTTTQPESSSPARPDAISAPAQPELKSKDASNIVHSEPSTPVPTPTPPERASTLRSRPETSDQVARRFICAGLGMRLPKRSQDEIEKQKESMELRRKQREDRERNGSVQAWNTLRKVEAPKPTCNRVEAR